MSQKSVIVVIGIWFDDFESSKNNEKELDVFSDLKTACDKKGWNYHSLSRKGDSFRHEGCLVFRKAIFRKGGEEKRKEKE